MEIEWNKTAFYGIRNYMFLSGALSQLCAKLRNTGADREGKDNMQ